MREFLDMLLEKLGFDEPWKPVSRPALGAWIVFYVAFLAYAFSAHGGFLFIDSANLVVHEGATTCSAGLAPRSAFGEARCCNGWSRFFWPCTSSRSARPPALYSACSFFSRTGSTPQLTWPTHAPWSCLWSRPAILSLPNTISTPSSPVSEYWITTPRLPQWFERWAGAG